MAAWIASLRDAALERREGAAPELLQALPPELAALYAEMNGASLLGEVRLLPLEESPFPREGEGIWRFGQKGAYQQLLTLPRRAVTEALAGAAEPSWLPQVAEGAWVYGVKEGSTGPLRLFRTLETMLGVLIPPPKEEFGEQTYARAVAAVHETLAGVTAKEALRSAPEKTPPDEEVTPSVANPLPAEAFAADEPVSKPKQPAARKSVSAKRPAAKKAPVTRKPKAKKAAAAKRSPLKKATGRKPAKAVASRKAAKRGSRAKAAATRKPAKKVGKASQKAAKSGAKKSARGKRGGRK